MIHTHSHLGEILKEMVFAPLGLTVTDSAGCLAMSRVALSRVLNGKAGISPDLAIRLEKAGASTASFWVRLQAITTCRGCSKAKSRTCICCGRGLWGDE